MKIYNSDTVLMATSVKFDSGPLAYRKVLRNCGGYMPYVIHTEALKLVGDTLVHSSFYWGHYFTNLKVAQDNFKGEIF